MLPGRGGATIMLKAKGMALGIMPEIQLEEKEIQLEKGDVVTLYTDGVTEAINKKNEQFGTARLATVVDRNHNLSASEIVKMVEQEVTEFSEGQPQFDDITLLILKVG
jgi:sigma-B regulation protein RsbU (phosphoserine phosphatase)